MSMISLEREILRNAKVMLCNKKLRMKDILAWSTGEVKPESELEIVIRMDDPGVNICVEKVNDNR